MATGQSKPNYYMKMLGAGKSVDKAIKKLRKFDAVFCTDRISTTCLPYVRVTGWPLRDVRVKNKAKGSNCTQRAVAEMDRIDPKGMKELREKNHMDIELYRRLMNPRTNILHPCCFLPAPKDGPPTKRPKYLGQIKT